MSKYLSPKLETVTPYTPGEQPQDQQYIKLNTNESPYLPSPAVVAAVSEHEVEKLRLYSDPACTDLLKTAAAHFGLQPDQIMPGNGSDENLFFALRAFCDETHPLAYADITYGCYSVWCGLMHIPSHIIPLKEDFTLDPADYYGLNETIVIANPNAPTGLALPRSAIEGILKVWSLWMRPMWTLAARAACRSLTGTTTCWWCRPSRNPASWPVRGWALPWAAPASLRI